ncbi:MAG: proline--tRNA ligase, partial [Polyangiaceae bacterium]
EVYRSFAEDVLAIPVIHGEKSESEKFAGALTTKCIEGLMQDGKALQCGTSHNLGQNFARAFDVQFQSKEGKLEHVHTTSWGVSTRLMGALIMAHGDDKGIVCPPRLAPHQVVFVAIWKTDEEKARVRTVVEAACMALRDVGVRVKVDDRDHLSPGAKFYEWEGKGVPVRVEVGPKDVEKGQFVVVRRDTGLKQFVPRAEFLTVATGLLETIHDALLERHKAFCAARTREARTYDELREAVETGWAYAPWCGSAESEKKVKDELKATIRCIPFEGGEAQPGDICVVTGEPAKHRVYFARSY